MSYIRPVLDDRLARPPVTPAFSFQSSQFGQDPSHIRSTITARRAEIASLEADWAAASERAAARSLGGVARLGGRETWDRATWGRYLSAAAGAQELYLPRLRRLYSEVERLERLQGSLPAETKRVA
jgi:hypothetical protein